MADLMSGVYTYDALADKYGNFHTPAVRLYVDGREAPEEMNQKVKDVRVELSLTAASVAVIRFEDIYDREKRSFGGGVKEKFKLGAVVEVGIGYGSAFQKVLKGFVALLGAEFDEVPCVTVTVMDVRRLMMLTGVRQELHDVKNYTDAVKTILGRYSKLCKAEVDVTQDKLETPLSQNATDYDFIAKELAATGRAGREFFVLGEKAYFRKPRKEKRPMMKVELGRELLMFRMENGYMNLRLQVTGYSQQEQKAVKASAQAKSDGALANLLSGTPVSIVPDPEADTQEKAKVRAEAMADLFLEDGQRGWGTCVGLPELVPGRYLEIVKLESMANKKYYVTSVRHNLDEKFFHTEFETKGWA